MTATERPLRKDAARNRELLIGAAREVFARRGLDASLDEVARQAGVGVGTAYRHFANKHELAAAIMDQEIDQVVGAAATAASAADPWSGLEGFIEAGAQMQIRNRGLRDVLAGMHDQATADGIADRIEAHLNELLQRAKDAGQIRQDIAPSDLGMVMMMACVAADVAGDDFPQLWRRYLPGLLAMFREGGADPAIAPLSDAAFRAAAAAYKQGGGGDQHC